MLDLANKATLADRVYRARWNEEAIACLNLKEVKKLGELFFIYSIFEILFFALFFYISL